MGGEAGSPWWGGEASVVPILGWGELYPSLQVSCKAQCCKEKLTPQAAWNGQ